MDNDVAARILEETEAQLRRVGPDRFRLTDVARELGMSHANVYRFFPSRKALITAMADRWYEEAQAGVLGIASEPGTAVERLERFVVEFLRLKRSQVEDPNVRRVLEAIIEDAPEAPERRLDIIRSMVADIITDGIAAGEFRPTDPIAAAAAFLDAVAAFYRPSMVSMAPLSVLEPRARAVVALIFKGLAARAS